MAHRRLVRRAFLGARALRANTVTSSDVYGASWIGTVSTTGGAFENGGSPG
jgi:hypothetical protein